MDLFGISDSCISHNMLHDVRSTCAHGVHQAVFLGARFN